MKGQSLIEVLVALGIISLIVTGVATIITQSLSNTQFSKDQEAATKYAQEGLETVRSVRNSNYATFATLSGRYCLGANSQSLGATQPSCTVPNVETFIREIRIEQTPGCNTNAAKVTATVSWTDGKCPANGYCHNASLVTCLSKINPVTAP